MTIDEMKAVLAQVKYKNFEFVILQPAFGLLLQARYFEEDIVTGRSELQYTRKWHLSQFMTKSELVQTALKLCLTAAEHEVRENFVYRDKRIFGPHFDVDKLHEMCSDKCLDVRPAAQTAGVPEEGPFGLALNVRHKKCHEAADAFWTYWNENGETHKRGYYESTWGAINAAIKLVGVVPHTYGGQIAAAPQPVAEQVSEQHDGEVVAATGSLSDAAVIKWVSDYRPQIGDKIFAAPSATPDALFLAWLIKKLDAKIFHYDDQMEGADLDDFLKNEWASGAMRQLKKEVLTRIAAHPQAAQAKPEEIESAIKTTKEQK